LTKQNYPNYEILVIANACSDRTVKVAKKFEEKLNLKVLETKLSGIGFASNLGARLATGEIFFFLDADTSISSNALTEAARMIRQGNIGGTILMKPDINKVQYNIISIMHRVTNGGGWGPVRICTSYIYEKVGGHRETGDYGTDVVFSNKLKSLGKTKFSTKAYYVTSMRRFEKLGFKEQFTSTVKYIYYGMFTKDFPEEDYPVVR